MKTNDFSNNGLLDALRKFNAKERFYLVGHFLGNPQFRPDIARVASLERVLNIPSGLFVGAVDTFCAMDYHLDWLNAALKLYHDPNIKNRALQKSEDCTTGTQQDIDLLLAFDTLLYSPRYHIVLIEAKGVDSFSNDQLKSKQKRFKTIFSDADKLNIKVHYVLMAPSSPKEYKLDEALKTWGWEFLPLPMPSGLLKVTRDSGKREWTTWKIEERK